MFDVVFTFITTFFSEVWRRTWGVLDTLGAWFAFLCKFRMLLFLTILVAICTAITMVVHTVGQMITMLTAKMGQANTAMVSASWQTVNDVTAAQDVVNTFDTAKTLCYLISLDKLVVCIVLGLTVHVALVAYRFLKSWLENGW